MKYKKLLSFLVAITLVVATFTSVTGVDAITGDLDSSLVLNKSATYLENGKVEITLETYATAQYSSYTQYPDMIFVLDMSGSMLEPVLDTNNNGITDNGEQSRYEALIGSVKAVINQIHDSGSGAKVAFIKYSDVNASGVYYKSYNLDGSYSINVDYTGNYPKGTAVKSQNLFFDLNNPADYNSALDLVNGNLNIGIAGGSVDKGLTINSSGLSRSDKGLEYDLNIISNTNVVPNGTVTIFYSDGYPKQSSTDDSPNLNKATQTYSTAENIKALSQGSNKIYAMILNGPDVKLKNSNNSYDLNHDGWFSIAEFADGVSSNTLGGNAVVDPHYSILINPGGSYSIDLLDAFQAVLNSEVTGPDYGVESQVRDYLSAVLELPQVTNIGLANASVDGDSVRVYTSNLTGISNGVYSFDDANKSELTADINLTVASETNGVFVSGFDYTNNLCYYNSDKNQYSGKKLIIVITTDLIPGFIGGNLVATNTDMSGFYGDKDKTTPINYFEIPTIDVPLEYEVASTNKKVYITNSPCNIESLVDIVAGVVNYSQDDQRLQLGDFTLGGHRNDYVNITYGFYDGATYLGTLTIANGASSYTGTLNNVGQLLENKTITVTVAVTPISNGTYPELTSGLSPVVEVVVPTINLQNSVNFLGETPEYDDFVAGVDWPQIAAEDYIGCGFTNLTGMPDLAITALDYDSGVLFDGGYDTIGAAIHGKTKVEANVATAVDITAYANYANGDIPSKANEFYLTIVDGEFTITKTSESYSNLAETDSNQGFIFKIEQFANENYSGTPVTTFYVTLDNAMDAKTVKYLEEGYYKITEADTWSDKYATVASQYIFVGRDGNNDFHYVNNDLDGTNQDSQDLVTDHIGDDHLNFDFSLIGNYNWIGDEAVARNLIPNASTNE